MKKSIVVIFSGLLFLSCKKEARKVANTDEVKVSVASENTLSDKENTLYLESFDWSKIPESTAEIGSFPYITAPEGFVIWEDGHNAVAKNGMTAVFDFNKLIIYNGNSFFNAEGKKAVLDFGKKDSESNFNTLKFDKSVDAYLKKIGAVLLFEGKIPSKKLDEIKKTEEKAVYKYIQTAGSPYDVSVRNYALNHKNGKIFFQFGSNSASAEMAVVELEGFKQTIQTPTASAMQKDIDAKGKVVLNINFDVDKAILQKEEQKVVDEIFTLLSNNPSLKLSIEGHTDNSGSVERNKKLSAERANTVRYALVGKGIDSKRLKSSGFGSEKPLATNNTEDNKAKNRRVELVKF
ncbi:OmpA family protein [Flavobacterium crassostreae]|uniref:OmpA-like domain-containing protein n=1 Tax=Flavobacterium crassostreae TaxID=1763534 RepID=A0A1B9E0H0_9FLAO|nr:OmpA family protein [Flavobacterium crassostreae]OCB75424.1 hypothetical protein LPBF_08510 [Flavobacterium crassostreae]